MSAAGAARAACRAVLGAALIGIVASVSVSTARAQVSASASAEAVQVPSLERTGGVPIELPGVWFGAPQATGPAPAVILLHGCGGTRSTTQSERLASRYRDYAHLLNQEGVHALVIDSFLARGEREVCTQRAGSRRITQANRRLDVLGAIQWLAARADVQTRHIGLLGWSHGGSAVLASINGSQADVAQGPVRAAFAIAFYPGCEAELRRGFTSATPLLLLLGGSDDWTAPGPCIELADRAGGIRPRVEVYEGAYHGFDGNAPLRLRTDVPNGIRPGAGVHVGGHPQARERARQAWLTFLRERLASR